MLVPPERGDEESEIEAKEEKEMMTTDQLYKEKCQKMHLLKILFNSWC